MVLLIWFLKFDMRFWCFFFFLVFRMLFLFFVEYIFYWEYKYSDVLLFSICEFCEEVYYVEVFLWKSVLFWVKFFCYVLIDVMY